MESLFLLPWKTTICKGGKQNTELGSSSVVLGVRCWFRQEDFWQGKWRVTEACKLRLDECGIEIAYDQLDVHIDGKLG